MFMVEDHLHEEKPLLLDSNMEALKRAQWLIAKGEMMMSLCALES